MATVVDAFYDRLTAALGPTVPVLRPHEIEVPKQGRTPGQPGGIPAFLTQHPEGYVQIERPTPITSDGLTSTFWVAVAVFHSEQASAYALGREVCRTLCGRPTEPGHFLEILPAQPEQISPGVWMYRPTFDALTIDGETAG